MYADMVDMGGIPVRQPLPSRHNRQIDPFLLLHHHRSEVKPGTDFRHAGVGPHPHRGFAPVTFIFDGEVHHRDSRGNSSIVKAGGVQWMNAGMGIQHSERPSRTLAEKGGVQEIIQLWINTPAKDKMNQPSYQAVHADDMPKVALHSGDGLTALVSGTLDGHTGPVNSPWPVLALRGEWKAGASHSFLLPEAYNAFIYLLSGKLHLEDYGMLDEQYLAWLDTNGDGITLQAREDARFILLAAPPIGEPLATYGPFVMNNQTQVMEAIRDYQMGKMGILIEEFE